MYTFTLVLQIVFLFLLFGFAFYSIYAQFSGAPFVPSGRKHVRNMLELASLRPGDRLIDIGSGDGRIVLMAGKHGVEATGIEINPFLVWWSRLKALFFPKRKVRIVSGNLWHKHLGEYDVVTLFFITGKTRFKKPLKIG